MLHDINSNKSIAINDDDNLLTYIEVLPMKEKKKSKGLCSVFTETLYGFKMFFTNIAAVLVLLGVTFRLWETAIVSFY